ncbi:MAG: hypothetical protein AAGI14_07405 [Pseudomonadota bacterium]
MISLPSVDVVPFIAPPVMLGLLAVALVSGAIFVALEIRAETRDR